MTNWTQSNLDPDWPIRAQALLAVERLAISTGGRIPWSEIAKGFSHKGQQIQLASRAVGIFKPRQMSATLSIKTVQPRAGRPSWYRDQSAGFDADDGPLLASLQGLDGGALRVPEEPLAKPDSAFLEWRFDRFEAAQT